RSSTSCSRRGARLRRNEVRTSMGVRIVRLRRSAAAGVLVTVAVLAAAACSGHSASTFTPEGGGSASAGGQASSGDVSSPGYVMPPFGSNVHIDMTSWVPTDTSQAAAANADKSYELATCTRSTRAART